MADQCIVCLEDLDVVPDAIVHDGDLEVAGPSATTHPGNNDNEQPVALIKPCGHILHDECLREWSQKANSCPICRHTFNLVEVLDRVGGTVLSEYQVEDKKQEASTTFDPNWIVDEFEDEEEESRPCPVCDRADQEEVLLLCDACNAPYHTHCIGLGDRVPNGSWYCMECEDDGAPARAAALSDAQPERAPPSERFPRTQAAVRRNRRQARTDHWFGTWSVIGTRVHNQVGLDLDFSEEDDQESMSGYRTMLHRNSVEQAQIQQFQRRLHIATRQGARDVFRNLAPLNYQLPQRIRNRTPPTPAETVEQSRAWGAFERAKEIDTVSPRNRKRKSRSATTSPTEDQSAPPAEPERKLKRPRTRRVLETAEASSSSVALPSPQTNGNGNPRPISPPPAQPGPSFLQSLLKEVDMNATSDDETSRSGFSATTTSGPNRVTSPSVDYSSPAASPSSSSSHTPRGLSITPPPHIVKRKTSPRPMTSRVEPIYPPADYSPNRSPGEASSSPTTEIRQPRPRRQKPRPLALARSPDTSPVRASMSAEVKEGINKIVKSVLAPHWKSQQITKEQYADINREVSRKLYEMVADRDVSQDKDRWEKVATSEVATAVEALAA